jgi:hypothetical protein
MLILPRLDANDIAAHIPPEPFSTRSSRFWSGWQILQLPFQISRKIIR